MRHSETEDPDVVLERLRANKPSRKDPQRYEAWQQAVAREEAFKRGKRTEWEVEVRHGQALEENARRDGK
jgi:hypothetical protein